MRDSNDIFNEMMSHEPVKRLALFSGGTDSLVTTHLAMESDAADAVMHIDTGIAIRETGEYVRETCRQMDWPLVVFKSADSYDDLVIDQGFPGPAHHWKMYHRLKERCLWDALRKYKTHRLQCVAFISGRRRQESWRRMLIADDDHIQRKPRPSNSMLFVNPILDWTGCHKRRYIKHHGLPTNPVSQLLCMSGECMCGAFAEKGELEMVRGLYPKFGERIDALAARVKAAGKHYVWGTRPYRSPRTKSTEDELPLCYSCQGRYHSQDKAIFR